MKKISILLLLISSTLASSSQSNFETFKKLFKEKDTAKINVLLANWEKTNPEDPEFYASAFNHYISLAKDEVISLQIDPHEGESLRLIDSAGNVAGYMGSETIYQTEEIQKAKTYIDSGISKFPNRLDMRFGKIHLLGLLHEYDTFSSEIIKAIKYSEINKNKWTWTENIKQKNGKAFFLQNIHSYMKQLYDTEDDSLLVYMIKIGNEAISLYPKDVPILTSTAVGLLLTKEYTTALEHLHKAEKIDLSDEIVLYNIANAYRFQGNNSKMEKYLKLAAEAEMKKMLKTDRIIMTD